MNFLFDTNVIVAALRSRSGASNALLRLALRGHLPLILHQKLVYEYREVLSRADHLENSFISWQEIEIVLAQLVSIARSVEIRYLWRPNLRDEGDNFLMEIAVAAWPCSIVTHNIKDFSRSELLFPHIDILTPAQAIRLISQQSSSR